ncbi:MAG: VOC family protein [Propionibacteriaceae bacterium]
MAGEPTYLELGVPDTAAARRFYGELLGWEPSGDSGNGSLDTATLAVGMHGDDPSPGFLVFLGVEDLEASLTVLERLGGSSDGEVHEAPGFGRYAICVDDQGVRFGLHQPEPS